MKKAIQSLGKNLGKGEQKQIKGGFGNFNPCPGSSNYIMEDSTSCSYEALGTAFGDAFPGGRCLGVVENGICC